MIHDSNWLEPWTDLLYLTDRIGLRPSSFMIILNPLKLPILHLYAIEV